jgi:hypothetical protein
MNREIKFRIWNKRIGWQNKDGSPCLPAMEYDDFIIYPNTGLVQFPEGGWDLHGDPEPSDNIVIMQYTGLKDKNDFEIYEGDIVKRHTYGGDFVIDTVVWFEDETQFILDSCCFSPSNYTYNYDLEVIGNIYQNPELLNL